MAVQFLRRTLISSSLKIHPSKLINYSIINNPFPLISSSFSTLVTPTKEPSSEIKDYFVTHHKFSEKTALKASTLFRISGKIQTAEIVLDYFKSRGFSDTQLEELVLCDPNVLITNFSKYVKLRVEKIADLGFTDTELTNLFCTVPGILTQARNANVIVSAISGLQNILGSNDYVIRVLRCSSWFIANDFNKVTLPNIKLLKDCGVSEKRIQKMIFSFPRFFLIKPETMRDCIRRVDEMGVSRDSNPYPYCVRALSSMSLESWNSKLKLLRSLGFTEYDIISVFSKRPNVLTVSERKILEVSKLLLSSEGMGVDISYIIKNSQLLVFSATTRVKPRMEIINALKLKGLLTKMPKMTSVCTATDRVFIQTFVLPYADQIGELGKRFIASRGYEATSFEVAKTFRGRDSKIKKNLS